MNNEFILFLSLIFIYGSVLIWYKLFGEFGLICFNVIATIIANIEVMILVKAFGMQQTLGNILFATTFLITDILSEKFGKKSAMRAVNISILATLFFVVISQTWMFYKPLGINTSYEYIRKVFSKTPRIMISGFVVYVITQKFDVFLYHKIWDMTTEHCGHQKKYLWLRNNASTLLSQMINTILFTLFAFYGTYNFVILLKIMFSSYVIFIFTSLADTPILYLARRIQVNSKE